MFEENCQDQELCAPTELARNLRHHSACLFLSCGCWDVDEKVIHLAESVRATCLNHLVQSAGDSQDEMFHQSAVESGLLLEQAAGGTAACSVRLKAARTNANPAMFRAYRQVTVPFVRQSVATRTAQALSLVRMHHCRFADLVFAVKAQSFCYQWLSHRSSIVDAADFAKKFPAGWTSAFEDSAWLAAAALTLRDRPGANPQESFHQPEPLRTTSEDAAAIPSVTVRR